MKYLLTSLLSASSNRRMSWRRIFVVVTLQTFGAFALWFGKLDGGTWAWFAAGLASVFIGGDTAEKFATVRSAGAGVGGIGQGAVAGAVAPEALGLGLGGPSGEVVGEGGI